MPIHLDIIFRYGTGTTKARRHGLVVRGWLSREGHSPPETPRAGGAELAHGKATRLLWSMRAYV
jgi:hypothetical protein